MAGVSDTDYNATYALTDVVKAGGATRTYLKTTGVSQQALFTLLSNIITNFNATNAKLDGDGGVTDEDFATNCNLTAINSNRYGVQNKGLYTEDLYDILVEMDANMDTLLAQLDADAGVEDENYASTLAVTLGSCTDKGVPQKVLTNFLDTYVTNFNALLAKLDADESA